MRLRPEQLQRQLQDQVLPVYLVSGDEPLLVQESCDAIRAAAREAGCGEREVLLADSKFNWNELIATAAEMSLFADRKLIELRVPSGKPGTPGSKALLEYLEKPSENILLLVAGKIDKQSTNSKWFKALDKAGAVMQIWPIGARELPRWLEQRAGQAGMDIDRDALVMLCDRVEGNLLAAVQEVEKLKLLCQGQRITSETVNSSVANSARYDLFALVDKALAGDAAHAMKMLNGLRAEGTEAAIILWALARELRLLMECRGDLDRGQSQNQVFGSRRVWDKRKPVVSAGLARHSGGDLEQLLHRANVADQSIKGLADGNPWDHLGGLVLDIACGCGAAPS